MTPPIKPDPPSSFYAMLVDALRRHNASVATPRDVSPPGDAMLPADRLRAVLKSPFADSMYAITGAPFAARTYLSSKTNGTYYQGGGPGADTLAMSATGLSQAPGAPPGPTMDVRANQPEYVFAHELGHRAYVYPTPAHLERARSEQDSAYNANIASTEVPGPGYAPYWSTNPDEHFAESLANAVAFLRATAGQSASGALRNNTDALAAQYEKEVPGTGLMVRRLLATPTYAHHPLKAFAGVPAVQQDATATPMQSILAQALLAAQKKRQGGQ